jgi:homoserine/homoserine lactone efflux protein
MNSYYLYIIIASITISSPGPGVVMTLTNSLKYGFKSCISGVLGVAFGMFLISILVGSGLGVLIIKSNYIYLFLQIMGVGYLLYLGIKLIIDRNNNIDFNKENDSVNKKESFFQGLGITLINPKPIIFFTALFPQFINNKSEYFHQFILLSLTFCFLIILIHLVYAFFANFLKNKSSKSNYFKQINVFGGLAYIIFAISLLTSNILILN